MAKDCTQCLIENLGKICRARKQGLCQKHYNEINDVKIKSMPKNCTECENRNLDHICLAQIQGLCQKHYSELNDKTHDCRVCIDTYVIPPNRSTQGYCDIHKNIRHTPKCKTCISLKVEKPYASVNNDLCIEHGADKPKCRICKNENRKDPNDATRNGLCREHNIKEKPKCIECIRLKVSKPSNARSGQTVCLKHGAKKE